MPPGDRPAGSEAGTVVQMVPAPSDLRARVASLEQLDNVALRETWRASWKKPAPKGARKRFLMLGIAWKWQADLFGGFGPELSRRLAALETRKPIGTCGRTAELSDVTSGSRPAPGTRLIREWHGERYEIHVVEGGYLWRGRTYGSLSAVAQAITGTNWNGPRFFGLREQRKAG